MRRELGRVVGLILAAGGLLCAPVLLSAGDILAQESGAAAPVLQQALGGQGALSRPEVLSFRTLDQDRLLAESRLGQETLARIQTAEQALEAENQVIFERLTQEEQALTNLRSTLTSADFREQADAFDAQVEDIRAERAQLSQELSQSNQALIREFFDAALPVLQQVMEEQGVAGLLRSDALVLPAPGLDITSDVIARLDAAQSE